MNTLYLNKSRFSAFACNAKTLKIFFIFLRLRVTQKALQLPFFLFSILLLFLLFLFLCSLYERTGKSFVGVFRQLLLQKHVTSAVYILWTKWQTAMSTSGNFVCESRTCHMLTVTDLSEPVESSALWS